jgi:ribonuclease HII
MDNKKTTKFIIGVDEVGRGPIAGPVAVCSFVSKNDHFLGSLSSSIDFIKENNLPKLKDSKKLSKKQREIWFEYLKKEKEKGNCDFAVSFVSSENIDKFGIAKCIQKALDKSLEHVISQKLVNFHVFTPEGPYADENLQAFVPRLKTNLASFHIFLDGGLHAPKEYINQETIIKGDELHPVISLASIIAKVSRDRVMEVFAKKYPSYDFDKNSGYGTKAHYEAIKKHGKCLIHRKTFIH